MKISWIIFLVSFVLGNEVVSFLLVVRQLLVFVYWQSARQNHITEVPIFLPPHLPALINDYPQVLMRQPQMMQ